MLIEALIAILIFALGILGMVAMGGAAVSTQSDSRYRTEASNLADAIASSIALNVDRSSDASVASSLAPYAHQATTVSYCNFAGDETTNDAVKGLAHQAGNAMSGQPGLAGASTANQQVLVETGEFNRVSITLCWKAPSDTALRKHTLVTYIN